MWCLTFPEVRGKGLFSTGLRCSDELHATQTVLFEISLNLCAYTYPGY